MSLDNAATDSCKEAGCSATEIIGRHPLHADGEITVSEYDGMSTRDLLIALHRRFDKVETIAENVQEQFSPVLEKIGKNPMLKMLLG